MSLLASRKTARDWATKNYEHNPVVNKYAIDLENELPSIQ